MHVLALLWRSEASDRSNGSLKSQLWNRRHHSLALRSCNGPEIVARLFHWFVLYGGCHGNTCKRGVLVANWCWSVHSPVPVHRPRRARTTANSRRSVVGAPMRIAAARRLKRMAAPCRSRYRGRSTERHIHTTNVLQHCRRCVNYFCCPIGGRVRDRGRQPVNRRVFHEPGTVQLALLRSLQHLTHLRGISGSRHCGCGCFDGRDRPVLRHWRCLKRSGLR